MTTAATTPIAGFVCIDKPTDWTSHDVVGYLRGVTRIKKIGHAGTLDPFATGLLIVGIGRPATKQLDTFKNLSKTYTATIHFGKTSDTQDSTGVLEPYTRARTAPITKEEIETIRQKFTGTISQIPPMYSAKKIGGKKLYELARQGKTIERAPNEVHIKNSTISNIRFEKDTLYSIDIVVTCSVGTYIRTLAHDIGIALGIGGYCETLRRTHIGPYTVDSAQQPKQLTQKNWMDTLTEPEKFLHAIDKES